MSSRKTLNLNAEDAQDPVMALSINAKIANAKIAMNLPFTKFVQSLLQKKMLIKQELKTQGLDNLNDERLRNILRKFDEDKDKIVSQAELRKTRHYMYVRKWGSLYPLISGSFDPM
ncbi:uncharacterized protein LOC119369985 isoform X2 [Jatropha curcas]|uniref:uncharacterized protein LOC119369985 isoform X2 n=1 Tax=Jatropha curcas TaxID=180498 RepID=UPI0018937073|nr:uncharacterized protein LOC119369985 isoform X2 [Jatropha curcas]